MLYAPIISNKPITVTNSAPIIIAVFIWYQKPKNIINNAYNPIIKNGIPNISEPNIICSPKIFPP